MDPATWSRLDGWGDAHAHSAAMLDAHPMFLLGVIDGQRVMANAALSQSVYSLERPAASGQSGAIEWMGSKELLCYMLSDKKVADEFKILFGFCPSIKG